MEKCVRYNRALYTMYVCSMLLGSGHSQWNHSTHPAHGFVLISLEVGAGWVLKQEEGECVYSTG